jgi:pectinesterase
MKTRALLTLTLMLWLACCAALQAAPTYTYTVAQDGSGNFRTLQEAVNACPNYPEQRLFIFVKNGVYREKLVIPATQSRIAIIGESVDSVVVTNADYSGKIDSTGKKFSTFNSYTCLISANNITVENVTFVNASGPVGQAVAVHVEGDRCAFRNCRFIGNQDTLLAGGESSRQYFADSYIEGTTDFIFGPATAVFERCTIRSKKNSYITAASTPATKAFGFVFLDCRLTCDSAGRKVYLGRPWRIYASTTFVRCLMGPHIVPEGWHNWNKPEAERTARYGEYESAGPGANPSARARWSHQLTSEEASRCTPGIVLAGADGWNPTADADTHSSH